MTARRLFALGAAIVAAFVMLTAIKPGTGGRIGVLPRSDDPVMRRWR